MVGLTYTAIKAACIEEAYLYAVALIAGNTTRWMDRFKVQGYGLTSFPEFKKLFIN